MSQSVSKWTSGNKNIDKSVSEWTSGNKNIDNYIKQHGDMIEWIPFDRFNNIKKIGEGGFGSVYSAIWLDGIPEIEKLSGYGASCSYGGCKKTRDSNEPSIVALKTLSANSKEFDINMRYLKYSLTFDSKLKIYGLTQNPKTNEYFMVFQYIDSGNLHQFLKANFHELTWHIKLIILTRISNELYELHRNRFIHADFHNGNILQDKGISENMQTYVADLGLTRSYYDDNVKAGCYGVMPYVAPEVLKGQKFTLKADIYSFGVIMSEMTTGQRPFDGCEFDEDLAMNIICNKMRPKFAPGTPNFYIQLAMQCMDSDPEKRPDARDVYHEIYRWLILFKLSIDDDDEVKRQFLDADKVAKTLPIISPKHPDVMYTSKLINTQKISNAIEVSKPIDTTEFFDD